MAEIAGTAGLPVSVPQALGESETGGTDAKKDNSPKDQDPQRLVRTCLSSLDNSKDFGLQMSREARRRCLDQASHKAFLGDGLPANWTIWKKHFRDFVAILDFMHAVEYVYAAALAISPTMLGPPGPVIFAGRAVLVGRSSKRDS